MAVQEGSADGSNPKKVQVADYVRKLKDGFHDRIKETNKMNGGEAGLLRVSAADSTGLGDVEKAWIEHQIVTPISWNDGDTTRCE